VSAADNQKIARRFFDDICNGKHFELANDIFTADYVYHDPQIPNVKGPQAMCETVKVFQDGVEGFWRVDSVSGGEDGYVTVRWTGTGKYTGAMPGIPLPPNGNAIEASALSLLRIEGDKIAEQWCVWDTMGFMQQIGLIPKA
jgi:predicted ester cyclase